ncbi:hypothetical protein Tco_0185705 [Tanacetum coccineum]
MMLGILKKMMNLIKNALNLQYGIPIFHKPYLLSKLDHKRGGPRAKKQSFWMILQDFKGKKRKLIRKLKPRGRILNKKTENFSLGVMKFEGIDEREMSDEFMEAHFLSWPTSQTNQVRLPYTNKTKKPLESKMKQPVDVDCPSLRRLITWQCKKQTFVATSMTEAEYVAAASCCGAFSTDHAKLVPQLAKILYQLKDDIGEKNRQDEVLVLRKTNLITTINPPPAPTGEILNESLLTHLLSTKKFLAQQRSEAIKNRPPNQESLRNNDDLLKAVGTSHILTEELINKMNKKDSSKEEEIKKESKQESQERIKQKRYKKKSTVQEKDEVKKKKIQIRYFSR